MTTQAKSTPQTITADPAFAEEIMRLGAEGLTRCYQCGTCSVVCPQTPLDQPFPRKEMVWAQWGLKDRLLKDMDVWLCHQCNLCSVYCPRDARPGDVMAAIRNYQMQYYATPGLMSRAATQLKYLPIAFIIPVLMTLAVFLLARFVLGSGAVFPVGDVLFERFIPDIYVDVTAFGALGLAFVVAAVGVRRFWLSIQEFEVDRTGERGGFLKALGGAVVEILNHSRFRECGVNSNRFHAHLGIMYGFIFLVLATTGAFMYTVVLPRIGVEHQGGELSLPLWDPVKVIGNVGGVLLLGGLSWAIVRRLTNRREAGSSTYYDWFFISLLFVTVATGYVLEILRFAELTTVAYSFYLVHLVFIYTLFIYIPFSKFAHLIYRTAVMTYARQIGREVGKVEVEAVATVSATP